MEYRALGTTRLSVSAIGLGCFPFGKESWGQVDDGESIKTIQHAFDRGINFFDTADIYGSGHAEYILGSAIRNTRDKVIILTKVGYMHGWLPNGKKEYIKKSLIGSLKRLQTDYIDIYMLHRSDPNTPIEESMTAFNELQQEGKIRFIGISNFSADQITLALKASHVDVIQSHYSMLQREIEKKIIPICIHERIGITTYRAIERGLLTGKVNKETRFPRSDIRSQNPLFIGESLRKNLEIVEELKDIARKYSKTVGQLAINWVLSHKGVTTAFVGAKTIQQLDENIGGAEWSLSQSDLGLIENFLICS